MVNWPNFFIVGAPKAGTTSIYNYLKNIPGIFMSPEKEPNYFSKKNIPDDHPIIPIRDKKKYLQLFKGVKDEKIIGEASPTYLADPEAPKLIHEACPDAKILISLRDPVERAFSHFLMVKGVGRVKTSFREHIEKEISHELPDGITNIGLYGNRYFENIKRYFDIFGRNQVNVIVFEEMIDKPRIIINSILDFLELDVNHNEFDDKVYNPHAESRKITQPFLTNIKVRKFIKSGIMPLSTRKFLREKVFFKSQSKPTMESSDRKLLVQFYYDDVQKLKELLRRNLPWMDF